MIEFLVLLLSTDWFLPYWTEIGIDIVENRKIGIQQGCREIVNQLTGGDDSLFLLSFSEHHRREAESKFLALLRRWEAERGLSETRQDRTKLSRRELTAVFLCATFNCDIPSADGEGAAPYLEFAVRAEAMKAWEKHAVEPSVFQDICLSSQTEWDIRTRKLLVSPKTLVNQLWSVLLDHRLRAFWADLRAQLTPQQLKELVSWYRAMIKSTSKVDSPVLPSYMIA